MSRVAVIGDAVRVSGFALAGALICDAADEGQAREAWRSLPPDVEVVVLTADAARWLAGVLGPRLAAAMTGTGGAAGPAAGGPAGAGPAAGVAGAGTVDGLPARPGVLPVVLPP